MKENKEVPTQRQKVNNSISTPSELLGIHEAVTHLTPVAKYVCTKLIVMHCRVVVDDESCLDRY